MSLHEDRIEKTLGSVTGDYEGQIPDPQSRIEVLLQKILENGGGSGSGIQSAILDEGQYDIHGIPIVENPVEGLLYLVPNGESGDDTYNEFLYVDGAWEKIGTTYENGYTKSELDFKLPFGVESITVGDTILDNVTLSMQKDGDEDWYISNNISGLTTTNFKIDNYYILEIDGVSKLCRGEYLPSGYPTFNGNHVCTVVGDLGLIGKRCATPEEIAALPVGFVVHGGYYATFDNRFPEFKFDDYCIARRFKNDNNFNLYTSDTSATHTVTLKSATVVFTQVPSYLSGMNGVARYTYVGGLANTSLGNAGLQPSDKDTVYAEGVRNYVPGKIAHVEGMENVASGSVSHAEGRQNVASGGHSHVEGLINVASGNMSHAGGMGNKAIGNFQTVIGVSANPSNNSTDKTIDEDHDYQPGCKEHVLVVGNGTIDYDYTNNQYFASSRSNAHTLDWHGNAEYAGDVKANACGGQNPVSLVGLKSAIDNVYTKSELDFKLPFGVESITVGDTILDNVTLSMQKDGDEDWYISNNISGLTTSNFTKDDYYILEIDGVSKLCRGEYLPSGYPDFGSSHDCTVVGDLGLIGKRCATPEEIAALPEGTIVHGGYYATFDNRFPEFKFDDYCIARRFKNDQNFNLYTSDTSATHTVTLKAATVVFTQVPSYLSGMNGVARYTNVNGMANTSLGNAGLQPSNKDTVYAEGIRNYVSGQAAHAEGAMNLASYYEAHVEGAYNVSSGFSSHAEGYENIASNSNSHAEGRRNVASGTNSHAEGRRNVASGDMSHVGGILNNAAGNFQTVIGVSANPSNDPTDKTIDEDGSYQPGCKEHVLVVGNGTIDYDNTNKRYFASSRSNAHTLDWHGNAEYAGDVKANACGGQNPVSLVGLDSVVDGMTTATASDEGKALKAKTVSGGKVVEWEFGETVTPDPEVVEGAVSDWLDEHPEATTTVEDGSISYAKLDSQLKANQNAVKAALLACFSKVAWIDGNGQNYYNALYAALYPSAYPLIVSEFVPGSHIVYANDALETLKPYLTVTYYTSESDSGTVINASNYQLSGDLSDGSNSVIVEYNTYTATFTVTAQQFTTIGLNKWGTATFTVGQETNAFSLRNPIDNRAVIVTASNNVRLKSMSLDYSTPTTVTNYSPIRIPKDAQNAVYSFGTAGWTAVAILSRLGSDDYLRVDQLYKHYFTNNEQITVDISAYNSGEYYCIPYANDSEQDPSATSFAFTF